MIISLIGGFVDKFVANYDEDSNSLPGLSVDMSRQVRVLPHIGCIGIVRLIDIVLIFMKVALILTPQYRQRLFSKNYICSIVSKFTNSSFNYSDAEACVHLLTC